MAARSALGVGVAVLEPTTPVNTKIDPMAHQGLVHQIARRYRWATVEGTIEYADLVQAGQIGLLQALEKYDGSTRVSTYAAFWIRHTIQRCVGRGRRNEDGDERRTFFDSLDDDGLEDLVYSDDDPQGEVEGTSELDNLRDLIAELPELEGKVIRLIHLQNTSKRDAAKKLGIPVAKVRALETSALRHLQKCYSGHGI